MIAMRENRLLRLWSVGEAAIESGGATIGKAVTGATNSLLDNRTARE
jgi:hypothetical protein